jgi:ABC-type phosphate transport system permease subunit
MRLSMKGLIIAGGVIWAFCILFVGILNIIFPAYGVDFLKLLASGYPGYKASGTIVDLIVGTLYALLDGAAAGFIFALLYNAFAGKATKKRRG